MSARRILVYLLRRDLRLADNPIFHEISQLHSQSKTPFTHLLPIYVFPAQQVEVSGFISDASTKSPYPEARSEVGRFWRCGPHRAKFLAESVWDLKSDLQNEGSDLILRVGMVGDVMKDLLKKLKQEDEVEIHGVWMTDEEGIEEKREEKAVKKAAESEGVDFRLWTDEKYYVDDRDVPFRNPRDLPDVFTSYRKSVEPLREAPRKELRRPAGLPKLPSPIPPQASPFSIPSTYEGLEQALLRPLEASPALPDMPPMPSSAKSAAPIHGGAKEGQKRIQHLLSSASMTHYKDTRNGLLGVDFSTKVSAWLALGCITARQVHWAMYDFEEGKNDQYKGTQGYGKGENKGTAAVRFELLWRDYMRLCTRKFGPRLFRIEGFRNDDSYSWKTPKPITSTNGGHAEDDLDTIQDQFNRFVRGTTGTGLIDASQRELWYTGYTSNRARQNVASFLAKRLSLNWKLGAEWYEYLLVDYDLSSNWGNWQYVSGVGNDPRGENRVFNPIKQSFDYDPQGKYVKTWVEETKSLSDPQEIFQIWKVATSSSSFSGGGGKNDNEEDQKSSRLQELGLSGNVMVTHPLKKIDFRVGNHSGGGRGGGGGGGGPRGKRSGGGGGGGGKYGGSSRPKNHDHGDGSGGGGHGGKRRGRGRGGRTNEVA